MERVFSMSPLARLDACLPYAGTRYLHHMIIRGVFNVVRPHMSY